MNMRNVVEICRGSKFANFIQILQTSDHQLPIARARLLSQKTSHTFSQWICFLIPSFHRFNPILNSITSFIAQACGSRSTYGCSALVSSILVDLRRCCDWRSRADDAEALDSIIQSNESMNNFSESRNSNSSKFPEVLGISYQNIDTFFREIPTNAHQNFTDE